MARNLGPKDITLNWSVPESRNKREVFESDFLILARYVPEEHKDDNARKWKTTYLKFTRGAVLKFFKVDVKDAGELRLAVSFEKDRVLFAFNPQKGVPFYKLGKSGNDRLVYNSKLVEKFFDHWKLDKAKSRYLIKVRFWAELNTIELFIGTPYHTDTQLPVFEDELLGKKNEYAGVEGS
jgi:hypothetical protein